MSKLSRVPLSVVLLVALLMLLMPAGASAAKPGPMLVLSNLTCVNGNVVAHFVVNKIPAGATLTNFQPGGDLAGGTVGGKRMVGRGQVAHFWVTLKGTGATEYDVEASVMVNGETINLHNAGMWQLAAPCGTSAYYQLCKKTVDGLTGTFTFWSDLFSANQSLTVNAMDMQPVCGPVLEGQAGQWTITEVNTGFDFKGATVTGGGTFVSQDLTARTVTFKLDVGTMAHPAVITFTNGPCPCGG